MKRGIVLLACFGLGTLGILRGVADDKPMPSREGAAEKSHWAFRRVVRPSLPEVRGSVRTPMDRFLLQALEARGVGMNPEADPETLIRRVAMDLTGLPPSLADVDAFLADRSPDAYERLIERYLASPHYGERWGKYWLDAAGYADSNGYFNADSDRPLAWKYRDHVIQALNADKPYDRFVFDQIAGDERVGFTPEGDIRPEMVEALTATHFLRNAPDGTGESDGNPDEVRIDRYTVLEGNLQNLMNCLLGLTIQCARCHSHKFEPVSQVEYYRLQAIFFPVYNPERWQKPNDRQVVLGTIEERARWQRQKERIDRQVKVLQESLVAFAEPLREQLVEELFPGIEAKIRDQVLGALKTAANKRTAEQQQLLKAHPKAAEVNDEALGKRFPEYVSFRESVQKALAEREKARPRPLERLAAFVETDPNPATHHVLRRGQHHQPGDEVTPGVISALGTPEGALKLPPRAPGQVSSGRRSAFAQWVTSPDNPLFARVMVNRLWQHHFGTGLVATPDNLGRSGSPPSHADLLDYLAAEFVHSGWSLKAMHRLLLQSMVYRQSSRPRPDLQGVDPENRLLSRFPLRRLDAEALRDSLLCLSGELDSRKGGPYIPSRRAADGTVEVPETTDGARRRSLYLQQRRTQVVTLLQLFDAPAMVGTCGKRSPSTVPLQPLALLNSEFVRNRARSMARRLVREAGSDANQRVTMAFRMVCSRAPLESEQQACALFLEQQRKAYAQEKDADERIWADLCQMILASNAALYVE